MSLPSLLHSHATCKLVTHVPMQLTAYFFRLNDKALAEIRAMRLAAGALRVTGNANAVFVKAVPDPRNPQSAAIPPLARFPLPPGVVSLHVRHGDKYKEMNLVDITAYISAAHKLVYHDPFGVRRGMFVSTGTCRAHAP